MTPTFATIGKWSELSGIGRTTTYSLLSAGSLRAVKAGGRTLIDVDAGLAWLRAQPVVKINMNRKDSAPSADLLTAGEVRS